jgi:hypothetical protein
MVTCSSSAVLSAPSAGRATHPAPRINRRAAIMQHAAIESTRARVTVCVRLQGPARHAGRHGASAQVVTPRLCGGHGPAGRRHTPPSTRYGPPTPHPRHPPHKRANQQCLQGASAAHSDEKHGVLRAPVADRIHTHTRKAQMLCWRPPAGTGTGTAHSKCCKQGLRHHAHSTTAVRQSGGIKPCPPQRNVCVCVCARVCARACVCWGAPRRSVCACMHACMHM